MLGLRCGREPWAFAGCLYSLPSLLCTSRRALGFSRTGDVFLELVIRVFCDFRLFTTVLSVCE